MNLNEEYKEIILAALIGALWYFRNSFPFIKKLFRDAESDEPKQRGGNKKDTDGNGA